MRKKIRQPVKTAATGLALLLTLAAFTTGCTPKIVQANPLADGYTRVETWKTDDITTGGNTIRIDAGVYMPDNDSYAVYEFVRGRFTQQNADRLIETIYGDNTLYGGWASPVLPGATAEPQEPIIGQIKDDFLDVMADTSSGQIGLMISNEMDDSDVNPCIQMYGGAQYESYDMAVTQADGIKTTPAQAVQIAQKLLDTCGFGGIRARYAYAGSILDDETGEPRDDLPGGYMVACVRYVDSMPITAIKHDPDIQLYWSDEQIWIYVDDTGVTGFLWISRCDAGQTLQSDVSLLPLASLKDTIRQGLTEKYADTGTTNTTETVTINTVRLELACVPSGDDLWQLVPSWCFYGTVKRYKNGKLTTTTDRSRAMIFAVSAIDGTIIE